jgi:hypothetical protein
MLLNCHCHLRICSAQAVCLWQFPCSAQLVEVSLQRPSTCLCSSDVFARVMHVCLHDVSVTCTGCTTAISLQPLSFCTSVRYFSARA